MKIEITKTTKRCGWLSLAALAVLMFVAACQDGHTPVISDDGNELVELQVNPGVATLTRSAIQGGTSAESGFDADTKLKSIAVYAYSASTNTLAKNNTYALYTRSNATWSSGEDKIYLSSDDATVYAYHPAYAPDASTKAFQSSGTPLKISGSSDVADDSTIPVSVFEGSTGAPSTIAPLDNADKKWSGNSWADNAAGKALIASAPGEVDYMYGTPNKKVDNGKGAGPVNNTVELTMDHALAMVSFRIYNDGTYHHAGALSKIKLYNASGTTLSKGTTPAMNIKTGAIASGAAVAATFTRLVNYTLITVGTPASATTVTTAADAAAASKKFSILVLPEATQDKSTVKAVFTIDGTEYDVSLGAAATNVWGKGQNYLYTVKLSGTELSVTEVIVVPWSETPAGELPIN